MHRGRNHLLQEPVRSLWPTVAALVAAVALAAALAAAAKHAATLTATVAAFTTAARPAAALAADLAAAALAAAAAPFGAALAAAAPGCPAAVSAAVASVVSALAAASACVAATLATLAVAFAVAALAAAAADFVAIAWPARALVAGVARQRLAGSRCASLYGAPAQAYVWVPPPSRLRAAAHTAHAARLRVSRDRLPSTAAEAHGRLVGPLVALTPSRPA